MKNIILCLIHDEDGASGVEYALMVALIALVVVVAVTFLGETTDTLFTEAANEFSNF